MIDDVVGDDGRRTTLGCGVPGRVVRPDVAHQSDVFGEISDERPVAVFALDVSRIIESLRDDTVRHRRVLCSVADRKRLIHGSAGGTVVDAVIRGVITRVYRVGCPVASHLLIGVPGTNANVLDDTITRLDVQTTPNERDARRRRSLFSDLARIIVDRQRFRPKIDHAAGLENHHARTTPIDGVRQRAAGRFGH